MNGKIEEMFEFEAMFKNPELEGQRPILIQQ